MRDLWALEFATNSKFHIPNSKLRGVFYTSVAEPTG
jgi:hypothetical protein